MTNCHRQEVLLRESSITEFHMPSELLAKVASFLGEDGVDGLKNLLAAGKQGFDVVYSHECLSTVRIDKSEEILWWSMSHSKYYSFFAKCLIHGNPYALWAQNNKRLAYADFVRACYRGQSWSEAYVAGSSTYEIDYHVISPPATDQRVSRPRCPRCARRTTRRHHFTNVPECGHQFHN
ncbi:PREDICTED: uncharacterized protein LOC104787890 [Camelina sativa]|uniref:Uncharacterized protein LOC104787890 n=1 Tax=Camelina sativa TaxID=90675 RepID=A0ABM0Z8B7_CAMSA|nr:PREDICTED: uncharacterized protein LOC104787890 [Camelina sativa]